MTDPEFLDKAEAVLMVIEAFCDRFNDQSDVDIDNQRTGGMLTLTFSNRSQIVINLQKPLHEIWMATKSGGFHYHWKSGHWEDTKGPGDLFVELSRSASLQTNRTLEFLANS